MALFHHATEVAIPYLMPVIYSGSTELPRPEGDVGYSSVRDHFALTVIDVIQRSKLFPEETRNWAGGMRQFTWYTDAENEEFIALIKSWWEKNQQAIVEKRYADATWIPRFKGRPLQTRMRDAEELEALREAKRPVQESTIPPRPFPTPAAASRSYLWAGIGVLLLALLGILGRKLRMGRRGG